MGMDMYIERKKKKLAEEDCKREELIYWRKFWGLHKNLPFEYGEEEYGKDIHLTKDDLESMLNYCTHNRNYFDNFSGVEKLCEIIDEYQELTEDGYEIVYNANW